MVVVRGAAVKRVSRFRQRGGLQVSIGEDSDTKSGRLSLRGPRGAAATHARPPATAGKHASPTSISQGHKGGKCGGGRPRDGPRPPRDYKSYSDVDSHSGLMVMNVIQVSLSINKEAIFIFL